MKKLLILLAVSTVALRADDTNATPNPAPPATAPAAPAAPVDDATAAHQGYPAARYESLWTKSPFAVETPDENVVESTEYSLVGVFQVENISYASLIEKQNGAHLLISSDKPLNDLTLNSITKKGNGDTIATFTRNGEQITLKLETSALAVQPPAAMGNGFTVPGNPMGQMGTPQGGMAQNIPMPGTGIQPSVRPMVRIHRPIVRVPQQYPRAAPTPVGQPAPPQPAQ